MKYVNAKDALPEELLSVIQRYYQGGYLYIPKKSRGGIRQQTDYKIELEKRNQYIYLKYLEGRTKKELGNIYHLSESGIRRIIAKERVNYQNMKEIIEQLLPLWGMGKGEILQIYHSAWEVNHAYVIKVYEDRKQLERNIRISEILSECGIPVAKTVPTEAGEKYAAYENRYFLLSEKLKGNNLSDLKDKTMAWKMGRAMAQLHMAFVKCERETEVLDNSLLKEMKGWIYENLENGGWKILKKEEYTKAVERLESIYDDLPVQLIHRDVHFGNFLFHEGDLSGYIDFDLSQRNIRIFDICYFLTGLLSEETDDAFTRDEWMENIKSVITGYESITEFSDGEKKAIPCVMECIEILFVAYYIDMKDIRHANDAYKEFRFIQNCENDMEKCIM